MPTILVGMERRQEALARFERATELPLLVLALAMVPLLVVPLLVDLPAGVDRTLVGLDWFIWAAFAFEYAVRLALSHDRWRFVRREWADLLIVVLPFLRPLRVVRSARALRLLRLGRLSSVLGRIGSDATRLLVRHHLQYAVLVIGIVVIGSAAVVAEVERGSGGTIDSFGNALWWAVATVTTVGYGDTLPVTAAGRGIAAFLMLTGISLFGILTANLTTFIVDRSPKDDDPVADRLDELLVRMDRLERLLAATTEGGSAGP